jgi:hypothetical protein
MLPGRSLSVNANRRTKKPQTALRRTNTHAERWER